MKCPAKNQIRAVIADKVWDPLNKVLYDYCRKEPGQREQSVVLTKAMLIGRVYAVALERNKKKRVNDNENFYRVQVYHAFRKMDVGRQMDRVRGTGRLSDDNIARVLELHGYLVRGLHELTDQNNRSFASKYLHFHLPDQVPILDSRALKTLKLFRMRIPAGWMDSMRQRGVDETYAKFVFNILQLQEEIVRRHGMRLTLREMDKLLLYGNELELEG
jgi:hypothetical protein